MSTDKPNGVGLPVVIAIAVGAAVLGALMVSGLNALDLGGSDKSDASREAVESPSSSTDTGTSDSETDGAGGSKLADSYIRWAVSTYVIDGNRECAYSDGFVDVEIDVTNLSQGAIVAGEGFVAIEDLLGNELLLLNIPIDVKIPSGGTATVGSTGDTCFSLNQFISDQVRLKEMPDPYSSTRVRFELVKLALESGEVISF